MIASLSPQALTSPPVFLPPAPASLPTLAGPLRDFVYSYLQREGFMLDERNRRELIEIGFDERGITRAQYRTVPSDIARLVIEAEMNQYHHCGLILNSGEGVRVAGFYFDGSRVRLDAREGQLIVPVKDARARIVALQTYRSARDTSPRWLDSERLPRGARQARSSHFARPDLAREAFGIVIAEHTLAADLHAWTNDEGAVAVNGLLPDVFARHLRESLPEVSLVAFAFALPDRELLRALADHGFEVCGQALQEVA